MESAAIQNPMPAPRPEEPCPTDVFVLLIAGHDHHLFFAWCPCSMQLMCVPAGRPYDGASRVCRTQKLPLVLHSLFWQSVGTT